MAQQQPKQSISSVNGRPRGRALEHGQLLAERQVLQRDRPMSAADQSQGPRQKENRSQHAPSCRVLEPQINRPRSGDPILANHTARGDRHAAPLRMARGRFGVPAQSVVDEVTASGFEMLQLRRDWPGRGPLASYCALFRKPLQHE
jgi:hypothetical protein